MSQESGEQLQKELLEARQRISELETALYERNRIEAAVKGSEERFRKLVENAHDVLWVFDLNLGYTYVSPSVKLLRGYTVEEAMQQRLEQVLTPESVKKARELFEREKLLEFSGRHHEPEWSYTTDFEMIHKEGFTFWTEMTMSAFYDEEGNIRGIMGITRDISERKQAEEELRKHRDQLEDLVKERTLELSKVIEQLEQEITERKHAEEKLHRSEERFQVYFSLSNDVMFSYDNQFRVQSVTPNVEKSLGYKPEELVGKTFLDLNVLHPDCVNEAIGNALRVLSGETVFSSVYQFISKEGKIGYGEVSGVPLIRDNKVEGEITVARDITERISMQKSLQESEERYRTTLQTLPDAVSIMSVDGLRYIYVNDAFCKITGYAREEAIGKTPFELDLPASPADLEQCEEVLKSIAPVSSLEHQCRTKEGAVLDTIISARPVVYGGEPCIVMIISDITAMKQLSEEKNRIDIKSQKMEAIGTLAAGIAHDFNNILTSIIGYAKMSMKDFLAARNDDKDLSLVQNDLTEVRNAAYRARDLVNHILAFSRHSEKDYLPIMLGPSIRDSLKLIRPSLPSNIKIKEDIEDSGLVLGDMAQIHLVMVNLCNNAVYAMDKTGGSLEVSVGPVPAGGAPSDLDVPEGPCLRLTVRDSGRGMSPQTMSRIFDPYFTTKGKTQGTGLGLSIIHGIVKSHGGTINCRSIPGKGTTFDIFLPLFGLEEGEGEEQVPAIHPDVGSRVLDLDKELSLKEEGEKKTGAKGTPNGEKKF
jgi:PAS domain S-box-containing protein